MAETYTNIRLILDKLLRNPLMADVSFETAVDYTIELIRLIGMPNVFIEKVVGLEVKDYRAALPCDFSEVIQIRTDDSVHRTLRYSTDSFHCVAEESRPYQNEDPTYKIQGGIIYTSFSSGRKSTTKVEQVDSGWQTYWGSSKELLADIKTLGKDKFQRVII